MTEKMIATEKKTRGPRRTSAEIAADYKERAEKAERKARLENTPGLKDLRAARELIQKANADRRGDLATSSLLQSISALVQDMEQK